MQQTTLPNSGVHVSVAALIFILHGELKWSREQIACYVEAIEMEASEAA